MLGAFASAGDMVAITGFQMMLLLHIEATYGSDPDVQRMWKLLPVIGGGFGWRTLARELAGFVPVAGVAIKGAIAYAGTIVVGESVTFFLEHGKHMSKAQAAQIYDRTKADAMRFARDLISASSVRKARAARAAAHPSFRASLAERADARAPRAGARARRAVRGPDPHAVPRSA